MQKYGILFIAENQGEIVGGNLYFHDEDNALLVNTPYQLFGNSIENKKQIFDTNCYIHWEAMQYFNNLDLINYDFDGENYFSRSFGGDHIPRYEYRKFNSLFYQSLFRAWDFFLRMYIKF